MKAFQLEIQINHNEIEDNVTVTKNSTITTSKKVKQSLQKQLQK